jgi:hypothetical protein
MNTHTNVAFFMIEHQHIVVYRQSKVWTLCARRSGARKPQIEPQMAQDGQPP